MSFNWNELADKIAQDHEVECYTQDSVFTQRMYSPLARKLRKEREDREFAEKLLFAELTSMDDDSMF